MENNYKEALKHVLCGALTHLDALALEINKLGIKEKPEDNDPESYKRARMMHLTMIAINDIIHPAHTLLNEYFQGSDDYFNKLIESFSKSKQDGLTARGCMCNTCSQKEEVK